MKILIASDKYKGCLTSNEVGEIIRAKIQAERPTYEVEAIPLADGGEGTMETLVDGLNGQYIITTVKNPIGNNIIATYGMLGKRAIIEMSQASGLSLLKEGERNPLKTTTYGTGMLIQDALNKNCKDVLIGIGGSATNDCGMGMAEALGVKFFDKNGKELCGCGENLEKVERIDASELNPLVKEANITVACDVNNKLFGKSGAAYVYGKQKGATDEDVKRLDKGMRHFAEIVSRDLAVDITNVKGGGAAGGLGAGLMAFLGAKLERGFKIVCQIVGLDKKLKHVDAVITGEGKTDNQTEFGKLPFELAKMCEKAITPCYLISGEISSKKEAYAMGFTECYELKEKDMTVEESVTNVKELLNKATERFLADLDE